MRIALIGRGHMGRQHASCFESMDDVEIVSVTGAAEGLAPLQDPRVEAVCVSTPTATHEAICSAALEAGKHVFCETPLAHDAATAERLLARARAADRHLQVGLLMRFALPGKALVESMHSCELGTISSMRLGRFAPRTSSEHHGDVLEELMLFDLDIALRALGEPSRVLCSAVPEFGFMPEHDGPYEHATALLDYGGTLVTCEASLLVPKTRPFRAVAEAYGRVGTFEGEFAWTAGEMPTTRIVRTLDGGEPEIDDDLGEGPILLECRHFADVVHGKADPMYLDASEALRGLRILDRLRGSLERSAWV